MSKKEKVNKFSKQPKAVARRVTVLARLEDQLKKNTKTVKGPETSEVKLTEVDVRRINKEVATLNART